MSKLNLCRVKCVHWAVLLVSMYAVFSTRSASAQELILKTETFTSNPGWEGRNNRATDPSPRQIVQNFGYSSATRHAGTAPGEIGGLVTPAGEAAYYAKVIEPKTLRESLSISGHINVPEGGGHVLVGFFNSETLNEWRTPNTIALRIYGRGSYFYAYLDYGTALWRAGGGSFGGESAFPSGSATYDFEIVYDPDGEGGRGTISARFGEFSTQVILDEGHKADDALFNRFGILNVMKSADDPGQIWLDDLQINGSFEEFASDPQWDHQNNIRTYTTTNVRPRFDFGFSPSSNLAGGEIPGEIGGRTFRGDSRLEFNGRRMAYYGALLTDTLNLTHRLHAHGKVAFQSGVSDSTTLIGFFHSTGSTRSNNSQNSATPENFVGVAIEGPSSEGFYFYPTYGLDQEGVRSEGGRGSPQPPYIYPDGKSRGWTLDYLPDAEDGNGAIVVTLQEQSVRLKLDAGHKKLGAQFNRFGIITTHIDGGGQTIYFDDITYTLGFVPPQVRVSLDKARQVRLEWLTNYVGYFLESSFEKAPFQTWKTFFNTVQLRNSMYSVAADPTNAVQFFRLRKR